MTQDRERRRSTFGQVADLAAVARRNLARFPEVEVVAAAFEDWPLPAEPFDLVLAATAFHWIDPAVRVVKAAAALRPGGALSTVTTHHVAGGDESFFAAAQACYERWDPETPPGGDPLKAAADIPTSSEELDPLTPVRPRDLPPPRVGAGLHDRRLRRRPPDLLRPPRARPPSPGRSARLHRPPDRHRLRRADHQAVPDRAPGRPDARALILGSSPSPPARRVSFGDPAS